MPRDFDPERILARATELASTPDESLVLSAISEESPILRSLVADHRRYLRDVELAADGGGESHSEAESRLFRREYATRVIDWLEGWRESIEEIGAARHPQDDRVERIDRRIEQLRREGPHGLHV